MFDGAIFPHIIKVKYSVDGKDYTTRKWLSAGIAPPYIGEQISITYDDMNPKKATIYWK
jgi:hypothetical protein